MMINILAISGSLRSNSTNTNILRAAIGLAADSTRQRLCQRVKISIYAGIGNLPHFNPELDGDLALAPVQDWRTQLQAADGVLFCIPEYAHGVPGALKNALDWIVSSGEFMNKPTGVISASPSSDGGEKANASLVQTLRVMMAEIGAESILCLPAISAKLNERGEIVDPDTARSIQSLLDNLVGTIDRT